MHPARRLVTRSVRFVAWLGGARRGATAVEYGLIVALIVIAMVASFKLVAGTTVDMWGNVHARVSNATGA